MAAFGELIQRITRSLEEAGAQRPGGDLRAQLGYGAEDDDMDEPAPGAVWEPETVRRPGTLRAPETARAPGTLRAPETARAPGTLRAPETARAPGTLRAPETARAPGTLRAPETARAPGTARGPRTARVPEASRATVTLRASETRATPSSLAAPPHHPHASPTSSLSERIRARLRGSDALREAFVVKEILDQPLGRRRRR